MASKKRSSRPSRRSAGRRKHGNLEHGEFDNHKYATTLQEAHDYLGAAVESARRHGDWQTLRTSVWRVSQALAELRKALQLLGRKGDGIRDDVRDLDDLMRDMGQY